MESYFSTTLNLFESLNIDNALSNGGVTHSSDTQYQVICSYSEVEILFYRSSQNFTSLRPSQLLSVWYVYYVLQRSLICISES